KLSFAKTLLRASTGPEMIVGSQLFYHLGGPGGGGAPGELRAVPLLPNGGVGTPRAAPDDPQKVQPENYRPVAFAAVQVGDRIVWLLEGENMLTEKIDVKFWACCSSAGEPSDLTRFLKKARHTLGPVDPRLGVDSRG